MTALSPLRLSYIGALFAVMICCAAGPAHSQMKTVGISEADAKRSSEEQGRLLAEVVQGSSTIWKCMQARVSLEKAYSEGTGGWLVQCAEGQDYWVVVPVEAGKAAVTLPCILVRTMGRTDCYANLHSATPEQIEACGKSPFPDRVISACTSLIQSGRLDKRPDALAILYAARGIGYTKHRQFEFALVDFDRAVALDPTYAEGLYDRAVAYERMKSYDKAIADLNEVLRLKRDYVYAYYERGFVYLRQGAYDSAIRDFDQTILMSPGYARAYRDRANAYQAKGDTARAKLDFAKAKDLEPGGQ